MEGLIEQSHPSLKQALELLERVRAEAESRSLSLAAAVVDSGGHVIASQRMDGSALGAMRLAIGKAYTAVLWGTCSGQFMETKLTFRNLSGPASAAHIHMGAKGVNGAILVPLCPPCTSPVSGTSTLTTAEIADMKARKLYVNVHTSKNPNGEIRGQITRAR
jgi:uncharacterized protein GlcG (DUF336 family)